MSNFSMSVKFTSQRFMKILSENSRLDELLEYFLQLDALTIQASISPQPTFTLRCQWASASSNLQLERVLAFIRFESLIRVMWRRSTFPFFDIGIRTGCKSGKLIRSRCGITSDPYDSPCTLPCPASRSKNRS